MMPLRCWRLDNHAAHTWTSSRLSFLGKRDWQCTGQLVIANSERQGAAR